MCVFEHLGHTLVKKKIVSNIQGCRALYIITNATNYAACLFIGPGYFWKSKLLHLLYIQTQFKVNPHLYIIKIVPFPILLNIQHHRVKL